MPKEKRAKYRIVRRYDKYYGTEYIVKVRVLGIFWRNFLKNSYGYATCFKSYEKARAAMENEIYLRQMHGATADFDKTGEKQ